MKPTDILHRAKTLNGEWIEGYYVNNPIDREDYQELVHFIVTHAGSHEIDPSTLCVWTTLTDNNGKKVFSGDLIKQTNFNGEQYTAIYEVIFDTGSFCLKMHKGNEKAMKDSYLSAFSFEIYSEERAREPYLQELFNHMSNEHGLILLQSEMQEIVSISSSIKYKEIEELKEKTKILITALEIIAESDPISIGLDEVEDLANSALTSFRDYENK